MACTTLGPKPRTVHPRVVRLRGPIITPDELISECAPPEAVSMEKALEIAELALRAHLDIDLEHFPYREQLTHPRAVWARVNAVALAHVRAALAARASLMTQIRQILDASLKGEQS